MRRLAALALALALAGLAALAVFPRSAGTAARRLSLWNTDPPAPPKAVEPYDWVQVASAAQWPARYAHVSVVDAAGTMVVAGGTKQDYHVTERRGAYEFTQHEYLNDVWMSKDNGTTWQEVPRRSDRWMPRRGHAAVMCKEGRVMFVLGGLCSAGCYLNDVWSAARYDVWSSHGHAPWSARHGHAAVSYADTDAFLVLGGHDGTSFLNDVWNLVDPTERFDWEMLGHAGWEPRYGHAAVVSHEKFPGAKKARDVILVLGGLIEHGLSIQARGDVWRSEDGGRTFLNVNQLAFPPRYQHSASILRGELFVTGGVDTELNRLNDLWRSRSTYGPVGVSWEQLRPAHAWQPRYEFSTVATADVMYLFGGVQDKNNRFHDVWRTVRLCPDMVCKHGEVCQDIRRGSIMEPRCGPPMSDTTRNSPKVT